MEGGAKTWAMNQLYVDFVELEPIDSPFVWINMNRDPAT